MGLNQKVFYFGYGASREGAIMAAITGNENLVGRPAVIQGFELCVQRLDQVPDTALAASPLRVSPRQILEESWPRSFESYIIRPGNAGDEVAGTLWELTPDERELVRDWELIEQGWYKDLVVTVVLSDRTELEVETEGLREDQEVDRVVNGMDYESFLNPLKAYRRVAAKSRKEYFERTCA